VCRAKMDAWASIYGCSGNVGPTCTCYIAPCHSRSQPAHPRKEHRPRVGVERRVVAAMHQWECPSSVANPKS
jgi:hypothetical protein